MSAAPPGGHPTTMRTGRDGYVCAHDLSDTPGSAAAPAARCRNCLRWGSFMALASREANCKHRTLPQLARHGHVTAHHFPAALVLDRKKLAAFSAAAGGFLRFPIGDRRCNRTRASVGNAGGRRCCGRRGGGWYAAGGGVIGCVASPAFGGASRVYLASNGPLIVPRFQIARSWARLQDALSRYPVGSLVSHSHCRLILSDFVSFVLVLPPTAFVVPSVKPKPPEGPAGAVTDVTVSPIWDVRAHAGRR